MMITQLDVTAELAAIPFGLAIALGVSFVGILAHISRDEMRFAKLSLVATYQRGREALRRRHIRVVPPLPTASRAH